MDCRQLRNFHSSEVLIVDLFSTVHLFSPDIRIRDNAIISLNDILCKDADLVTIDLVQICINDIVLRMSSRTHTRDDRLEGGTEACLGYPDTEGWGSLETSLKALNVCLSHTSTIEIFEICLPILEPLVIHTNRFAREHAQMLLHEVLRTSLDPFHEKFVEFLVVGLQDNWSQVRYATGNALRRFVRRSCIRPDISYLRMRRIIPLLLINRHFVAEGIKRQSQHTWRIFVGPSGGSKIIANCIDETMDQLIVCVESINHSTRESAISCMYELLMRVFLQPENREILSRAISSILRILVSSLEDEAWSVREYGQKITSVLYSRGISFLPPTGVEILDSQSEYLAALIFRDLGYAVIPIRVSASKALATVVGAFLSQAWSERLLNFIESNIDACCSKVPLISPDCGSYRRISADEYCENRPMYSCGSLVTNQAINKLHVHSMSDDCCSLGAMNMNHKPQAWEISDGCLRLYAAIIENDSILQYISTSRAAIFKDKIASILRNENFTKFHEIHALILASFSARL